MSLDNLLDAFFVSHVDKRRAAQIAFALRGLLREDVAAVSLATFDLARTGELETLLRSGLSFHLGHVLVLLIGSMQKIQLCNIVLFLLKRQTINRRSAPVRAVSSGPRFSFYPA